MPVTLLQNPQQDEERKKLFEVFDQMQSGEVYSPGENGQPGLYALPEVRRTPEMASVQQQTGVADAMAQRNAEGLGRVQNIAQETGSNVIGLQQATQFNPEIAAKFAQQSPADQMAAELVQAGKMSPKDFYSIAKKAETDRMNATLNLMQNIDPNKNPVTLSQDGTPVPFNARNLSDAMSPQSGTDVNVGRPYPTMVYNFGQGGDEAGNARQKQAALRAAEFSEKEKEMIGALPEGQTLLTNMVEFFKTGKFGGIKSLPGQVLGGVPLAGKYLSAINANYQNMKETASEKWLRAATGAAAPEPEVKRYAGFLPDESDPPEVADTKIANFMRNITAKAQGRAEAIALEGRTLAEGGQRDIADMKVFQAQGILDMINSAATAIPKISETKAPAAATPPAPTASAASFSFPDEDAAQKALDAGIIKSGDDVVINGRKVKW